MKYFKIIGVMSLLVFSFYLTDFVTDLAINNNPLMQTIKETENNYYVKSVDATIKDKTIIPGIKGKKINEMESFLNMKDFGSFNINYLVYDLVKPDISIEDNVDKIIISGNKKIRQISLLIRNNESIIKYLKENDIKYSKLIKYNDEFDIKENINIENDKDKYNDLNILLTRKKLNNKICILDYSNIEICHKNKYYIVKPTRIIKNINIVHNINEINSGDILLIDEDVTLDNFKILLKKINNKDLKCVYLSEIIKE